MIGHHFSEDSSPPIVPDGTKQFECFVHRAEIVLHLGRWPFVGVRFDVYRLEPDHRYDTPEFVCSCVEAEQARKMATIYLAHTFSIKTVL